MNQHDYRKVFSVLQRAMESPCGVEAQFFDADSVRVFRQRLYAVRKEVPEFKEKLSIVQFATEPTVIWIIKPNREDWNVTEDETHIQTT